MILKILLVYELSFILYYPKYQFSGKIYLLMMKLKNYFLVTCEEARTLVS